jgi:hypothetical protein
VDKGITVATICAVIAGLDITVIGKESKRDILDRVSRDPAIRVLASSGHILPPRQKSSGGGEHLNCLAFCYYHSRMYPRFWRMLAEDAPTLNSLITRISVLLSPLVKSVTIAKSDKPGDEEVVSHYWFWHQFYDSSPYAATPSATAVDDAVEPFDFDSIEKERKYRETIEEQRNIIRSTRNAILKACVVEKGMEGAKVYDRRALLAGEVALQVSTSFISVTTSYHRVQAIAQSRYRVLCEATGDNEPLDVDDHPFQDLMIKFTDSKFKVADTDIYDAKDKLSFLVLVDHRVALQLAHSILH